MVRHNYCFMRVLIVFLLVVVCMMSEAMAVTYVVSDSISFEDAVVTDAAEPDESAAQELSISKLELKPDGEAVIGEKLKIDLILEADNDDETLLNAFVIDLQADISMKVTGTDGSVYTGDSIRIAVNDTAVKSHRLYKDDVKLEYTVELIVPSETAELQVRIFDSEGNEIEKENRNNIAHKLLISADAQQAQAEDTAFEPKLELRLSADPATLQIGDSLTMTAVISGLDGIDYTIRWQCDNGVNVWQGVPNGEGPEYTVELTQENLGWSWRYIVEAE